MIDISKRVFGLISIIVIAILQLYAWNRGLDGHVFAFTSLCIGGIVGVLLGIKLNINQYMKKMP